MRLIKNPPRAGEKNTIAQVSYADSGGFGVVGASEITDALVFAPRGMAYRPCPGDHLILLLVDGADACVGVLNSAAGLLPGEVRLTSSGGASIKLCSNGDVAINGVVITKDGRIVTP